MHIYEHPSRHGWLTAKINWSRQRAFSEGRAGYIRDIAPAERGVYCVYATCCKFPHEPEDSPRQRWSRVVYIGSGYIPERLTAHLLRRKNDVLAEFVNDHYLAYRYDRITDADPTTDWPRQVEAALLTDFAGYFGGMPPANRRPEPVVDSPGMRRFFFEETGSFSILGRG